MLSVLLIAAAAALWFGGDLTKLRAIVDEARKRATPKVAAVAALVLAALLMLPTWHSAPEPEPQPDLPFSLRGEFTGSSASQDAATVGALLSEIADEIEYDGKQQEPSIRTGLQIDQLRKAARLLRCRGESIGDRQVRARDKIAAYLDEHVGNDGGPLTEQSRGEWVSAFRECGRAASDAAK
jgi:hypothetical protein